MEEKMKKVSEIWYGEDGIENRFRNGSIYILDNEAIAIEEWVKSFVDAVKNNNYAEMEGLQLFYSVTTSIEFHLLDGEDDSVEDLHTEIWSQMQ